MNIWNPYSKWYTRRIAIHINKRNGKHVIMVCFPYKIDNEWCFNYWKFIRLPI